MVDCMPKEQQECIEKIEKHCLEATNMTKEEAWNFAFRCWQLGYDEKESIDTKAKQGSMIKKMAEFISTFDIDEQICKDKQFKDDCGLQGRDCVECIIRHFMKGE